MSEHLIMANRLLLLTGFLALLSFAGCNERYGYGGGGHGGGYGGGRGGGGWGGGSSWGRGGDRVRDPIPVPNWGRPAPPANHPGN